MSFMGKYVKRIVMCDWCDPPAMDVPGFRGKEMDGLVEEICLDCLKDASDLIPVEEIPETDHLDGTITDLRTSDRTLTKKEIEKLAE